AFEMVPFDTGGRLPDSSDVLVVTGGARGITAECVIALATETRAALGLIGRADPASDAALEGTLARMRAAGVRYRYERADVRDRLAVKAAIDRVTGALGPINGLIHGAAVNQPVLLADMEEHDARETVATKLVGLEAVLGAVERDRLRLLVAFGSLIARTGMRGDAHYAVANEALRIAVTDAARTLPACRCLTIEWSAWAGTGMGERLGLVGLEQLGVTPLTSEQGVTSFLRVLATKTSGAVVVCGRVGSSLPVVGPALPLARFVEQARVWYPGIELVADTQIAAATDPYVSDHVLAGDHVLPAVIGLESMVQAAAALRGVGPGRAVRLHDIRFDQPIVIPDAGTRTLRAAALARDDGSVDVALRCDATGFAVDHFALRCAFDAAPTAPPCSTGQLRDDGAPFDADGLYDELLFQRGRFRRIRGYLRLEARRAVAELSAAQPARYFGAYV